MSRVLGEAFVVLRPDATDFRADATAKIKAATQGINPNVNLGVNLNTAQLAAKTAAVKAAMSSLGGVNLGVNLNDDTLGSVAGLESRLAVVRNSLQNMPVTIDDATSIAKLASLQVQAAKLDESLKNMSPGMNAGPAAAQLLGLEASMKRLTDDQGALAESADGMTHVYGMWTTVISALRGHISLFGGALEGLVPEFLASVSGFHLLLKRTCRRHHRDNRRLGSGYHRRNSVRNRGGPYRQSHI